MLLKSKPSAIKSNAGLGSKPVEPTIFNLKVGSPQTFQQWLASLDEPTQKTKKGKV